MTNFALSSESFVSFVADDWGMSPGINDGILILVQQGVINRVSLMANTEFLTYRLDELLASNVPTSFHLCLTYGTPLCDPREVGSLVHASGTFFSLGGLLWRLICGQILNADLRAECERQAVLLRSLGVRSDLLEAHHNVHLVPKIFFALRERLEALGFARIRGIKDSSHCTGFIATHLLKAKLKSGAAEKWKFEYVQCAFPADGSRAVTYPVVIHPASIDDFDAVGCNDSLRGERVDEMQRVQDFFARTSRPIPSPASAP